MKDLYDQSCDRQIAAGSYLFLSGNMFLVQELIQSKKTDSFIDPPIIICRLKLYSSAEISKPYWFVLQTSRQKNHSYR